ncbi:MAG: hypothetical protein WCC26_07260 [Terracidiphilus sp.]
MSEKVFALLLRLFPPEFRKRYGEEALQLYRDRAREERGFLRRAKLSWDLLMDLFAGLPKTWQTSYSVVRVASQAPSTQLVPSFRLLQPEPLRPASILLGSLLAVTIVGVSALVLRTAILHPIERHTGSPIDSVLQRLNQPVSPTAPNSTAASAAGDRSAGGAKLSAAGEGTDVAPPLANGAQLPRLRVDPPRQVLARPNGAETRVPSNSNLFVPSVAGALGSSGRATATGRDQKNAAEATAASQTQAQPQDATQAMLSAITAHQIVMFGETHANKQEYVWLCTLVKTPAFADRVDDIVVEFGNSLYQKTVDRYIAGEDVPQEQVEKAWRNVIGAVGPVSPVYGEFYAAVRASNLAHKGKHAIRLVLGDPYGDWDKIKNAEDLGPYVAHRDEWYAQVVRDEVLAKHHRALLIMGAGHFLRRNGPGLVERTIRAEGVDPYLVVLGTNAVSGYDDLDPRFDAWHTPAIVQLNGNWVGVLPAMPVVTGGVVAPNALKMADVADALLYVGPRDALTEVNVPRAELEGTAYGAEVNRRLMIQMGRTMEFTAPTEEAQYRRPPQQTVSNGIHRTPPNPPKSINDPLPPRPPSQ